MYCYKLIKHYNCNETEKINNVALYLSNSYSILVIVCLIYKMTPNSKLIVIIVIAIDTNTAPKILVMLNDFRIMLTNIMLQRIQSLEQDKMVLN